jgi:hypothetical protein
MSTAGSSAGKRLRLPKGHSRARNNTGGPRAAGPNTRLQETGGQASEHAAGQGEAAGS